MLSMFREHPRSVGESYAEHLCFAGRFGLRMIAGGIAAVIHGCLPFLFETTGSRTIFALNDEIHRSKQRRAKSPDYLTASHSFGSGI